MGRTKRKDHRGFHPKGRERHQSGISERIWEEQFETSGEAFFDTDDRASSYPCDASDVEPGGFESVRVSHLLGERETYPRSRPRR